MSRDADWNAFKERYVPITRLDSSPWPVVETIVAAVSAMKTTPRNVGLFES